MAQRLSQSVLDKHQKFKSWIREAEDYWSDNLKNYHEFRNFLFDSTLTQSEKDALKVLKKPPLQFNVLEAYVSRLCGEWSKQTPSFVIHTESDNPIDVAMVEFVKGHLKLKLCEANAKSFSDDIYREILSGGYSAMEVLTDYKDSSTFDQHIYFSKPHSPTQCGWDPLARDPAKGDGRFCYKKFPMSYEAFQQKYPDIEIDDLDYTTTTPGFAWAYTKGTSKVVMVVDLYEKTCKYDMLYFLTNGQTMTRKDYEELKANIEANPQSLEILPEIKKRRRVEYYRVERYRMIENQIIEHVVTEYEQLPIIFVDGNSAYLNKFTGDNSCDIDMHQKTRPYIYNARDAQRLMNFSAQSLAAELENTISHKIMAPERGIPEQQEYLNAYIYPQIPQTLIYRDMDDDGQPVNPPTAAPRQPIPPELLQTFSGLDQKMQAILGSYDASLGINDNQLSGVAIVEGATQSNNAAMPYVIHYMQALTRAAEIFINLIPKYFVTPRTIPVMTPDDRRAYIQINQPENPQSLMVKDYSNSLHVEVKAGLNFEVQQNRALQFTTQMAQSFDGFKAMINAKGLPWLVNQLNINGVDQLQEMARQFQQQMEQQQAQQAQQAAQQGDPNQKLLQLEAQKIQDKKENDLANQRYKEAELTLKADKQRQDQFKAEMQMAIDRQNQIEDYLLSVAKLEKADKNDSTQLELEKMKQNRQFMNDLLKTIGG